MTVTFPIVFHCGGQYSTTMSMQFVKKEKITSRFMEEHLFFHFMLTS